MLVYNGKQHDHFFMDGQNWHSANYFPKKYKFKENDYVERSAYSVDSSGVLRAIGTVACAIIDDRGFPTTEAWVSNIITKNNEDYALVNVALPGGWSEIMAYVKMSDFGGATPL